MWNDRIEAVCGVCGRWNKLLSDPHPGSCIWGDVTLDLCIFGTILYQRYEVLKPQFSTVKAASVGLSSYATSFFQRFSRWLSRRSHGIRDVTIRGYLSHVVQSAQNGNQAVVVDNVKSLVTAYFVSSWFPDLLRSLPPPDHHIALHFEGDLCGAPHMKSPETIALLQRATSELHYSMTYRDSAKVAAQSLQFASCLCGLHELAINLHTLEPIVIAQLQNALMLKKLTALTVRLPGGSFNFPRIGSISLETLSIQADLVKFPLSITALHKLKTLRIEGVLHKYPVNPCNPGLEQEWWPINPGSLMGLSTLSMTKSGITSLSPSIGLLSRLESLDLSMNGLRGYQSIAVLGQLTSLRRLILKGNLFSNADKIGQLCDLQSLTEIDLSMNVFLFIPKVLLQLRKLQRIDLSGNHVTLTRTLFGLAELHHLAHLHVGLNATTRGISHAMLVKYQRDVVSKFVPGRRCKLKLKITESSALWWTKVPDEGY